MTQEELQEMRNLIDMDKESIRELVQTDTDKSTRFWTKGELIVEAIERGLTRVRLSADRDQGIWKPYTDFRKKRRKRNARKALQSP